MNAIVSALQNHVKWSGAVGDDEIAASELEERFDCCDLMDEALFVEELSVFFPDVPERELQELFASLVGKRGDNRVNWADFCDFCADQGVEGAPKTAAPVMAAKPAGENVVAPPALSSASCGAVVSARAAPQAERSPEGTRVPQAAMPTAPVAAFNVAALPAASSARDFVVQAANSSPHAPKAGRPSEVAAAKRTAEVAASQVSRSTFMSRLPPGLARADPKPLPAELRNLHPINLDQALDDLSSSYVSAQAAMRLDSSVDAISSLERRLLVISTQLFAHGVAEEKGEELSRVTASEAPERYSTAARESVSGLKGAVAAELEKAKWDQTNALRDAAAATSQLIRAEEAEAAELRMQSLQESTKRLVALRDHMHYDCVTTTIKLGRLQLPSFASAHGNEVRRLSGFSGSALHSVSSRGSAGSSASDLARGSDPGVDLGRSSFS
jgi:hypothetical protein